MSFQPKDSLVRERELKVIELHIPFVITGSATPASVSVLSDEPSILFMNTAGVNQTTAALSPNEAAPTFAAPVDASGLFNMMLVLNETVGKVVSAEIVSVTDTTGTLIKACYLANTTGISQYGNKICLNVPSGVDFATGGTLTAALTVRWAVAGAGSSL
jgi:hypothetical protein